MNLGVLHAIHQLPQADRPIPIADPNLELVAQKYRTDPSTLAVANFITWEYGAVTTKSVNLFANWFAGSVNPSLAGRINRLSQQSNPDTSARAELLKLRAMLQDEVSELWKWDIAEIARGLSVLRPDWGKPEIAAKMAGCSGTTNWLQQVRLESTSDLLHECEKLRCLLHVDDSNSILISALDRLKRFWQAMEAMGGTVPDLPDMLRAKCNSRLFADTLLDNPLPFDRIDVHNATNAVVAWCQSRGAIQVDADEKAYVKQPIPDRASNADIMVGEILAGAQQRASEQAEAMARQIQARKRLDRLASAREKLFLETVAE